LHKSDATLPRLVLSQLLACNTCRHVARKYGMYGSGDAEMAAVDQIIDGVEVSAAALHELMSDAWCIYTHTA
jgi:hypothetical protein